MKKNSKHENAPQTKGSSGANWSHYALPSRTAAAQGYILLASPENCSAVSEHRPRKRAREMRSVPVRFPSSIFKCTNEPYAAMTTAVKCCVRRSGLGHKLQGASSVNDGLIGTVTSNDSDTPGARTYY